MGQVWLDLKYGMAGHGITLCKLDSPYVLRVFKQCALGKARQEADESKEVDRVIHTQDQFELARLQILLEQLIPDCEEMEV